MKMPSLFVAAAGLTLLGASPPPMEGMDGPPGAGGYPPCSHSVRDRCIQLYERGVANWRNMAMNERLGPGRLPRRYAHGPMGPMGPRYGETGERRVVVARDDYPPCGDGIGDRCIQAPRAAGGSAPAPRRMAVRVRYDRAMVRTGERG